MLTFEQADKIARSQIARIEIEFGTELSMLPDEAIEK
jgi:hypothetical protein